MALRPDRLFYLTATVILLLIVLYLGQALFIPLFYGLFIAIVLYPVCRWLEQKGLARAWAITSGLLVVFLVFGLLLWLLALQVQALWHDWPALKEKLIPLLTATQEWVRQQTGISFLEQHNWLLQLGERAPGMAGSLLAGTMETTATALFMLFIIPVFAALFLYNRSDFVLFLEKLAGKAYHERLHHILHETIHTYFQYVKGIVIIYLIVGLLNTAGLLALGIKHAFLFGFLTAIMTIIPYVGIFISALLPITVAWITKDNIWYPLGVIGVFGFVQYLEANIIFPKIVGAQLNVSTWATLVAFIAGGIVWGVNGMILFIPFVAILKMVSDAIPEWEALNILLRRNAAKPLTQK